MHPLNIVAAKSNKECEQAAVLSVFDMFRIGIGPSSSHTVGPMRAALIFSEKLRDAKYLFRTAAIRVELFGSLGATGKGHGTDCAVLLGLEGASPETIEPSGIANKVASIRKHQCLELLGIHRIRFVEVEHLISLENQTLPFHPNGLRFTALDATNNILVKHEFFSIGGGFVVTNEMDQCIDKESRISLPFQFDSCADLLRLCKSENKSISRMMLENELVWRSEELIRESLLHIWEVMRQSVESGLHRSGQLPGGLAVRRRAAEIYRKLLSETEKIDGSGMPLETMDWISLYAMSVGEENAAGRRVVTAPTNGAAGIVPAVLHYYDRFCPGASPEGVVDFLLTAGAIGILCKKSGSISGAEVGCQGEVGSACAMAAAGLTEILGGTPTQVENAAEIAMEHHLGLTCDPVAGLVQIPCIERNAIGAIKAISAARMALHGDGTHHVSFDQVIKTMLDTGRDMKDIYRETSRGGLAINVVEC